MILVVIIFYKNEKTMIVNLIKKTKFYKFLRFYKSRRVYEGKTSLNILKKFPLFEAHGYGLYPIRAKLTIQSINQVVPALSNFSYETAENLKFYEEINNYLTSDIKRTTLGDLFTHYGSDKATAHNYHLVYNGILSKIDSPKKILEIGLGTNNTDIVSTMGKNGRPGASLRAFRDFSTKAKIYGADFDERVLFDENRIKTFFVDQTSESTLIHLGKQVGKDFDLMIDDGLHSPNANLHSLYFFMSHLRIGGYAVIEDINPLTENLWKVVSSLIEPNFKSAFISTKASSIYVVQRTR